MEPPLERYSAAMIDGLLPSVTGIFWIIDKENSLHADKLKDPCKEESCQEPEAPAQHCDVKEDK